jgi:hypothetical protein
MTVDRAIAIPDASSFTNSRCVVTSGLGFTGSNVVHVLAAGGAYVTVVVAPIPHHGGYWRDAEDIAEVPQVLIADLADAAGQYCPPPPRGPCEPVTRESRAGRRRADAGSSD